MQGLTGVPFFAHRAHHRQIPLCGITDHILWRRIHHFIVCANFLPLLYASRAEDVLALSTLFRLDCNRLANAADEVLVKLCNAAFLKVLLALFFRTDPAVRSRVNLHGDILSYRLATSHDLFDFIVLQYEEAIIIFLSIHALVHCERALRRGCTNG